MIKCFIPNCKRTLQTLQGAKTHLRRSHQSDPMFEQALNLIKTSEVVQCTFCQKVLANKFSLERHESQCKSKQMHEKQQQMQRDHAAAIVLLEKDKELIRLEQEKKVLEKDIELEKQKSAVELQAQHIEDLKQIVQTTKPTVINNNNSTVINNNNRNTSYTQNNTLNAGRQQIDGLVPITTQGLSDMVQATFKKFLESKILGINYQDLCELWICKDLKDSLLVTDTARGVTHWRDGDKNNKAVKDVKCHLLTEKLQEVCTQNVIGSYFDFLKKTNEGNTNDIDKYVQITNTQLLLVSLQSKKAQLVKEFGPMITKYARCVIEPADFFCENKKKFNTFVSLVEREYFNFKTICVSSPEEISERFMSKLVAEIIVQSIPISETTTVENKFQLTSDSKESIVFSAPQLLDFIKYCIVEAYDYPTKHAMFSALELFPDANEEQVKQLKANFSQFVEWFRYDRYKERDTQALQTLHQSITEYEDKLIKGLIQTK
jgi:hypothetical protein